MIYLLGGSGYVGSAYRKLFYHKNVAFKVLRRCDLDYANPEVLRTALQQDRPEFLINAAGYTGKPTVDICESHKEECLFANAILPSRIARICEEEKVPFGHVSSGCIYTGTRANGTGFTEEDSPNFTFRNKNCSFYSGSKALGEELRVGQNCAFIWRLRIPFNNVDDPRNYLSKLMRYLQGLIH